MLTCKSCQNADIDLTRILLKRGRTDPSCIDIYGKTALDYADPPEIRKLFFSQGIFSTNDS